MSTQLETGNLAPIVAKVRADKPDAIYASGYFFTAGPLVSQLRSGGVTVPVIGQEGYDGQQFIKIAGAFGRGSYHHHFP